jgi:tetratricopeptide (TPR) repeat protein
MDTWDGSSTPEMEAWLADVQQGLLNNRYSTQAERDEAAGVLAYYQKDYNRSANLLTQALTSDPENQELAHRLENAQQKIVLKQEQGLAEVKMEHAKALFKEAHYHETMQTCDQVLAFSPGHAEATLLRQESKNKIVKPEIEIAQAKIQKQDYVAAYIHLKRVQEIDPRNPEALQSLKGVEKQLEKKEVKTRDGFPVENSNDKDRLLKSMQLYNEGLQSMGDGRYDEAEAKLTEALKYSDEGYLRDSIKGTLSQLKTQRLNSNVN